MTASTHASAARGQPRNLRLALVTLLMLAPWARADDAVPPLRQGLWEYQRTAGTQRFAATQCIDPSEDLRRQHADLARMGCKFAPAQREGATYTYAADCALKLSSGIMTYRTVSVLTAASDSAYRIENRVTDRGGTKSETITAQRVADCGP